MVFSVNRVSVGLKQLLADLACSSGSDGQLSCSVYDTAIVAKIRDSETMTWFAPGALAAVVECQLPTGAWPSTPGDKTREDILSTLAAINCLLQHQELEPPSNYLELPIRRGIARARKLLANSHLLREQSTGIAFEVNLRHMLEHLKSQDVILDFEHKKSILACRRQHLFQFCNSAPYKIGLGNDDCESGLMSLANAQRRARAPNTSGYMASPSATAYNYPVGSDYLREVIRSGEGINSGAVPSIYPTQLFELLIASTTMLDTGIWKPGSMPRIENDMLDLINVAKESQGGVVGFAPGVAPDLHNSARASLFLSYLNIGGISTRILTKFRVNGAAYLKTSDFDSMPSLVANCCALRAMIHDKNHYMDHRDASYAIVRFICGMAFESGMPRADKLNMSPLYSIMNVVVALNDFILTEEKVFTKSPGTRVLVTHTLRRCTDFILREQKPNGSWGDIAPKEETAYAVMAARPLLRGTQPVQIQAAGVRGINFLRGGSDELACLWIEKTPFRSELISRSCIEAAVGLSAAINSMDY